MSAKYRFTMRAEEHNRSVFYHPLRDSAERLTIVAATKQEAMQKAGAVLGKPRRHHEWGYRFDGIEEVACKCEEQA